jgi:hypothetical protein
MPCIVPLTISVNMSTSDLFSELGVISLTWGPLTGFVYTDGGGNEVQFGYNGSCQIGPVVIASNGETVDTYGRTPSGTCGTFTINRTSNPHTFFVTVMTGGTSYTSVTLPNNITIDLTHTINYGSYGSSVALSWNGSDYVNTSSPNGLSITYSIEGDPSADTCLTNGEVLVQDNSNPQESYGINQPNNSDTQQILYNSDGVHYATVNTPTGSPPSFAYSAFIPTVGNVGDTVIIYGSGFTCTTAVSFNGTPAITFTVVSDTEIIVVIPSGATAGPITVTTCVGSGITPTSIFIIPALSGPAVFHYS